MVLKNFLDSIAFLPLIQKSIVTAIADALLCFEIPFARVWGQCYDGCSKMSGVKGGVAVKIWE